MFFLLQRFLLITLTLIATQSYASEYIIQNGDSLSKILVDHGFEGDARQMFFETRKVYQNNTHAFRRNNINLLIPGATLSLPEYTPEPSLAGILNVKQGEVRILRKDSTLSTQQSSELHSGDVILTMQKTQCRLDMQDGGLYELGPNTKFSIDDYMFRENEGLLDKASRAVVTLLAGIARSVSGRIGQENRHNTQFKTGIATIGIRGTDYTVRFCEGDDCGQLSGTSVAVVDGRVVLKNDSGELPINKGEFAIAASADSAPYSAPMPEGFLDMSKAISDVNTANQSWWQKLLELF